MGIYSQQSYHIIQLSQVEGIKGIKGEKRDNSPALTPLVAQSIRPFYSLLIPFLPLKPLGSGACETSVT